MELLGRVCISPGMTNATTLLEGVSVAKPCPANWDDMTGDDRVRNCALCKLDVYDLSAMTRDEAAGFVASRTGQARTCIRFFRRDDGTILTQDCPVGIAKAWKKTKWAAAALLAAGFASAAMLAPRGEGGRPTVTPFREIYDFVDRHFGTPVVGPPVMGAIACPPAPPVPPPAGGGGPEMGDMQVMGEMEAPPVK